MNKKNKDVLTKTSLFFSYLLYILIYETKTSKAGEKMILNFDSYTAISTENISSIRKDTEFGRSIGYDQQSYRILHYTIVIKMNNGDKFIIRFSEENRPVRNQVYNDIMNLVDTQHIDVQVSEYIDTTSKEIEEEEK